MATVLRTDAAPTDAVRVRWDPCVWVRLTRFPSVDHFARLCAPDERPALVALASWTEPGSVSSPRDPAGPRAAEFPAEDGPDPVLAAFAAVPALGAWLSDGANGLFFAAGDRPTALAEAKHRVERFLRDASAPSLHIDARVMEATLDGRFLDLRRRSVGPGASGTPTPRLVRSARARGYDGILYDSPRHRGGDSVAVFRPDVLTDRRPAETLAMLWDGERIAAVYEKRSYAVEV